MTEGKNVTIGNSSIFAPGDGIVFYGVDGRPRKLSVVGEVSDITTITLTSGPSLWERAWYYMRHPSWWKFALDIPFRPPDYPRGETR